MELLSFYFYSPNKAFISLFSASKQRFFSAIFSLCFCSLSNSVWELSKRWSHSPLAYGVDRSRSTGQLSGSSTSPSNRSRTGRGILWVMKMLVADVGVQRVWASPLGLLCMPHIQSYILSTALNLQCAPFCSADLAWRGNARELGCSCPADMAPHQSPGRKQLQVRFHSVVFESSWRFLGLFWTPTLSCFFFFFFFQIFCTIQFFDMLCVFCYWRLFNSSPSSKSGSSSQFELWCGE